MELFKVAFIFSLKRPFAPLSIKDIHLNDVVKFSRPEGKISKGTVKFIGPLPDRIDHYLGLELEDEGKYLILNIHSIHLEFFLEIQIVNMTVFFKVNVTFNGSIIDFTDFKLISFSFSKPNKGVFVSFNKVILAWS